MPATRAGGGLSHWSPQSQGAVDRPSFVHVETFTVQSGRTVSYQLTPWSAPGSIRGICEEREHRGRYVNVQYSPGFDGNKTTYNEIIPPARQ